MKTLFVLALGIAFVAQAGAADQKVGEAGPALMEPNKAGREWFEVNEGLPHPGKETARFESEMKKAGTVLPDGTKVATGIFSSLDENFYSEPLKIPAKDQAKIERILKQGRLATKGEKPLAREDYHQANYKIVWCRDGYSCNVHVYGDLRVITSYRMDGSVVPLLLKGELFDELVAVLKGYRRD